MVLLVIVNFGNVIGEFSGIAGSLQLFHVSKYISVPICSALVWLLAVRGDYKTVEKIFLFASTIYFAYIIAGVLAHPGWHEAWLATIKLPRVAVLRDPNYVFMVVAVIGTTIAPWMQFYLQSSIVEKGVTAKTYAGSRIDVIVGSIFTDVVAWFIVVACAATLWVHGITTIQDASNAAEAMKPLAGQYAFLLFSFGLFNAGFFAASVLPLSTAYVVCEGLGVESGVDKRIQEAPFFYGLYTLLIVGGGAAVMLIPNSKLIQWYVDSQTLNGILLPVVIVLMLILINRKDLMGEHVNSRWFNGAAWATAIIVSILSVILMVQQLRPGK
jgi:Mn2+/Fe2+ NRAMP family transporter